jgi:hypothetical protein
MPDASVPENDPSIQDSEKLYLRIPPDRVVSDDCPAGEFRPGSGALRSEEALSVDLASMCTAEQTQQRGGGEAFHVAVFTAGMARKQGCRIMGDPQPGNDAHALIFGNHLDGKGALGKSQTKQIAKQARIICWDNRFPKEHYENRSTQPPSTSPPE